MQDFIVIDTEGKDYIREIAVINQQGELIYEAFTQEYFKNNEIKQNLKPLKQIILDFLQIAQDKLIICHFAQHDREVLRQSCLKVRIRQPKLKFDCSVKLSQQYFPNLQSYSLV
jgi:DNA polymerase III epsilon subunit-like protein